MHAIFTLWKRHLTVDISDYQTHIGSQSSRAEWPEAIILPDVSHTTNNQQHALLYFISFLRDFLFFIITNILKYVSKIYKKKNIAMHCSYHRPVTHFAYCSILGAVKRSYAKGCFKLSYFVVLSIKNRLKQ